MYDIQNLVPVLTHMSKIIAYNPLLKLNPDEAEDGEELREKLNTLVQQGLPLLPTMLTNGFIRPRVLDEVQFSYFEFIISVARFFYLRASARKGPTTTAWLQALLSMPLPGDPTFLGYCRQALLARHGSMAVEGILSPRQRPLVFGIAEQPPEATVVHVGIFECLLGSDASITLADNALMAREFTVRYSRFETMGAQCRWIAMQLQQLDQFLKSAEQTMSSWPKDPENQALEVLNAQAELLRLRPKLTPAQESSFNRYMPDLMPNLKTL